MSYDPNQGDSGESWQQPGQQQPGYDPSGYQQPGQQQPGYDQSGYQQPGYQQPAYGQPAYQQPAYGQPQYGYGAAGGGGPKNDGMAIASMVVSICGAVLSFLCCGFWGVAAVPCVIGAVLGFLSRKKIAESNGALGGDGFALAGMIVGGVGAVWAILWLVLAVFLNTSTYWSR